MSSTTTTTTTQQQEKKKRSTKNQTKTKTASSSCYSDSAGGTLLRRCVTAVTLSGSSAEKDEEGELSSPAPTTTRAHEIFDMRGVQTRRDAPAGWCADDFMSAAATARTLRTRAHTELHHAVRALAPGADDAALTVYMASLHIKPSSSSPDDDGGETKKKRQQHEWTLLQASSADAPHDAHVAGVRRVVLDTARLAPLEHANIIDEPPRLTDGTWARGGGVVALLEATPLVLDTATATRTKRKELALLFFYADDACRGEGEGGRRQLTCVADFAYNHPAYRGVDAADAEVRGRWMTGIQLGSELAHRVGERRPFEYGCGGCGRPTDARLKCGRCRAVYYCGPACQHAHWTRDAADGAGGGHRAACRMMRMR